MLSGSKGSVWFIHQLKIYLLRKPLRVYAVFGKKKAAFLQVGPSLELRDLKAAECFGKLVPENGHSPCMKILVTKIDQ